MNFYTKIKFSTIIIIALFITSCSSDDDLDITLLYGDWTETAKCEDQNRLTFSSNSSYNWIESQNTGCDSNWYPTRRTTGSFSVSRKKIVLNKQNSETIDPGEHTPDMVLLHYISSRILILTESDLEIEITYRNDHPSLPDRNVIYSFFR